MIGKGYGQGRVFLPMRLKPGVTGPGFSQTEQLDRRPAPSPQTVRFKHCKPPVKAWWETA